MRLSRLRCMGAKSVCAAALLAAPLSARDVRSAEIGGQIVTYEAVDGLAIAQGDLILGTLEEIELKSARTRDAALVVNGSGNPLPWPDGVIYYTISPDIQDRNRITSAIEHWNARTPVKLMPHTGQVNYVSFIRPSDPGLCASSAGMIGGRQFIQAGDYCGLGPMIHEIGHAAGLMHEQIRPDRNTHVTVLYENIDKDFVSQFHQGSNTVARGYYDYDSIMHYSARAATTNRDATIVTVPPGIPLGQSLTLSAGDIDAIQRLYGVTPTETTITTIPAGLRIVVDGQSYIAPQSFPWGQGSTHTIAVESTTQGGTPRYRYVRWTDGGAESHTVTVSPQTTAYAAIFRSEQSIVTGVQTGAGAVTLQPASSDGFYPEGTPLRITAEPTGGEVFRQWTGTNFESTGNGRSAASGMMRLYAGGVFHANFTNEPLTTITTDPPGLQVLVDGVPYLSPISFPWPAGTQHTLDTNASQESLTGATRYRFEQWQDGALSSSRIILSGSGTSTHTATFRTQYYLSLATSGGGFLVTQPQGTNGYFDAGTEVTINALTGGRTVQYWLGDLAGGGESRTIVMNGHKRAVAIIGGPAPFRPVNAASYLANPVFELPRTVITPLEILTLFGSNIGPASAVSGNIGPDGRVTTTAGGTRVFFGSTPAPVLYVSPDQISVVVPADVAGKAATVIAVQVDGALRAQGPAEVIDTLPGIFTADASGKGQIAIVGGGPVSPGDVIVFYASGAGLMDRSLPDGAVVGTDLPRPAAPVHVRIGGLPAEVIYNGGAPGLVYGALQLNVRVPELLLPGPQPVQLIVGQWASPPGTTLMVK